MKHFHLDLNGAIAATHELWQRNAAMGQPGVMIHQSSVGFDTDLSTPDPDGEHLLRIVLNDLHIRYTEHDEQQVFTGWEGLF